MFNRRDFLKTGPVVGAVMTTRAAEAQAQQSGGVSGPKSWDERHWNFERLRPMNVVVIIVDTLRYDYIGAHGNTWMHTPNFDRLAKKSWIFDRAFTNSYPTIPMRTDVITGRYGLPFHAWQPLTMETVTMPRVLAKAGYCTQLIHDTPHLVNGGHAFDWPFHAWTQVRGAEVDRPWIDDKPLTFLPNWKTDSDYDFRGDPYLRNIRNYTMNNYTRANRNRIQPQDWNAAKLFLTASDFLRDNARRDNFFLWIDSFDPHEPWDAPPQYVRMYDKSPGCDGSIDPRVFWAGNQHKDFKDKPELVERVKALYAAKVTHLDHWLGEFLDTLETTGLDKNTAIILTADHGTVAGEHREFGKRGLDYGAPEGHIPMWVSVPGAGSGRSSLFVQPQDIFPTVLGIAGIEKPKTVQGFDMLQAAQTGNDISRQVAVMGAKGDARTWRNNIDRHTFTVFGDEWVLKFTPPLEKCTLYRYDSDEENLAASNPSAVANMRAAGLEELARQGLSPKLIDWLQSEETAEFPDNCHQWPERVGNWASYWQRTYNSWI